MSKFFYKLSVFFAILGMFLLFLSYSPSVYYLLANKFQVTVDNFKLSNSEIVNIQKTNIKKTKYEPRFDPTLSKDNVVKIPSIKVETVINESIYKNYSEALKKGVWRVSDFGDPTSRKQPTILVAHRFGYLAWTNSFRRYNSFYNLPKLKVGDIVEIIWRQRKYVYEVYGQSKGEEIGDYNADLILYTCETLNGPIRIFKYARLLEI